MKKNIIVATDLSQRSFEVITKAFDFAQKHNFQVHVVHILEKGFFEKLKDENTVYENIFVHLKEKLPTINKEQFHCRQDSLEDGIERFVKELNAAMVIIGSSGERRSVLGQFLGSSTKSIVRAIDVPTLVVKSDKKTLEFDNIMVPSDLSKESSKYIDKIHNLFPQAQIEMLHSYLVPFEGRLSFYGMDKSEAISFQDNMKTVAVKEAYDFYDKLTVDKNKVDVSIIKDGLDPEAFVKHADENKRDLIAIHTTGNFSFFAFDLLEHSDLDILITKFD
jgi:nucleotide-binding universal stress UspA family protein